MSDFDDYDEDFDDTDDPTKESDKIAEELADRITVTIDFSERRTGHTIEEEIISRAVSAVMSRLERHIDNALSRFVAEDYRQAITDRVVAIADAMVDEQMNVRFQRTNTWGEPAGEKTTMREVLEKEIKKLMEMQVDAQGRPAGYRDVKTNRINWVIAELVREQMEKTVREETGRVTAEAKKQVQKFVSEFIGQQLMPDVTTPQLPES